MFNMQLIAKSMKKERGTVAMIGETADIYFCALLDLFYLKGLIIRLGGIPVRSCLPSLQMLEAS
jgi:hypothetical protein